MRPKLFVLVALLVAGCAASPADKPADFNAFRTYAAAEGVHGTLAVQREGGREHLAAVTQLEDGTCLAEEATMDRAGRVLRAEATLAGPDADTRVVFDPLRGNVDISAPSVQIHWKVPSDLPWVWTSLLNETASGEPIATPFGALVALRAASADLAVRSLDLENLQSHTIMADQVIVPETSSVTVVLGDDAAEVADGMPRRIHLAALRDNLQIQDAQPSWKTALAAFSCTPRDGSRTL